jgi:uncharacterized protein YeaO (DUF488 family)
MIYLSNFKTAGHDDRAVSIAAITPRGFKGEIRKDLSPPWSLVKAVKNEEKTETEFMQEYGSKIYAMDLEKIASDLEGKIACCYCHKSALCHRSLLGLILYNELGVEVEEIGGFGELFTVPFKEVGNPLCYMPEAEDVEKYGLRDLLATPEEIKAMGFTFDETPYIIYNKWKEFRNRGLSHIYTPN